MTLKEVVQGVQNLQGGGISNDDNKLSDEQVADMVHYYRSKLIRQELDRGYKLDPMLIQPLFKLEVERVTFNRNEPLSGKTVFRTIKKLPRAISTRGTNLVTFVGHNLLGQAFQRTTPYKTQFDIFRPFTGLNIKWFEFDEKIYVITEDPLKTIVVQLVAENPTKVVELNGGLDVYNPFDYEYPISNTMIDTIFKLMVDSELKIDSTPTDDVNDGIDTPTKK